MSRGQDIWVDGSGSKQVAVAGVQVPNREELIK